MDHLFYKPSEGWVGDVIPYCEEDTFYLFYLHERRESPREGMGWRLVKTRDFIHYEDCGDQIVHGSDRDPDFNAYTGSVVKDNQGRHHLFYTGQNPRFHGTNGLPLQVVMHAISEDGMQSWRKIPSDTFGAFEGYETGDWRDPFVFWDDDSEVWRLILAARNNQGPLRRRGVVAQCVSKDLSTWEPAEPLWNPKRYITQECPDVFSWGDWWYLVYSEFSDSFNTRYRVARSLAGPWNMPDSASDTVDGRAFYAAKTACRDGRRFFFGWIPTRTGNIDEGAWQWAGTMSVIESKQREDGSLAFCIPEEVLNAFPVCIWRFPTEKNLTVGRSDGYECQMLDAQVPRISRIHVGFDVLDSRTTMGVILRASEDGNFGHIIRAEPAHGRVVVDRWPRKQTGGEQWQISGDISHAIELERPCDLAVGTHELDIVLDDDICVVNIDGSVMLSTRMESVWGESIGVFSNDGITEFKDIEIYK